MNIKNLFLQSQFNLIESVATCLLAIGFLEVNISLVFLSVIVFVISDILRTWFRVY